MIAAPPDTLPETNQRHLMAALGLVREALQRHAAQPESGPEGPPPRPVPQPSPPNGSATVASPLLALDTLCSAFALSPFERDLLLMCAGVELDATFPALCAAAHGDPQLPHPTFGLALAALPDAHWSAIAPAAPLRRYSLIEIVGHDTLTRSPLRIDERILHFLTGLSYLDERLRAIIEPLPAPAELPPSHAGLAGRIEQIWRRPGGAFPPPIIQLRGPDHGGKLAIAASACASLGLAGYLIRAADVPTATADRDTIARLWEREASLTSCALLIDCDDIDGPEASRAALALLESIQGILFVTGREALPLSRRHGIGVDVDKPAESEQQALWQAALGLNHAQLDGQLDAAIAQFRLDVRGIQAAGTEVLAGLPDDRNGGIAPLLWDACRAQARPRLDDLAQRIVPEASWDDLVLPEPQLQVVHEITAHVRQRAKVYNQWGFAAKGPRGLGISALFAGASGTGKTLAAEVVANELRLDLYRIDLSQIVSKYIGETEKNLRRVFDAAEDGGTVLLFDEADALFGKRSEVKDSHDRFANIEVSYLLQRMEAYRGLAILTTNMKNGLDTAFLRRIRFSVEFPFPNAKQRAEIWRRIFPPETPTADLDVDRLAQLNVAGGNIRNIALLAAFLAADAGESVRMPHLLRAARTEYAKLEKPLTGVEKGGWA